LKGGRIEYVNLEERRFVWIDGMAASLLDNSDMPVLLRLGDRCKARWKGGTRQYPEHYVATVTKLTKTGASLKFARKVLGEAHDVPWNDIEQCRCSLTKEAATKLRPGDMISARWRHGNHWPGWYGARVVGVYIKKKSKELLIRVTYANEHANSPNPTNHDDVPLHDLQIPMLAIKR